MAKRPNRALAFAYPLAFVKANPMVPGFEKRRQTGYDLRMSHPSESVPWNTPALWQEANHCLSATIRRNRRSMGEPDEHARLIRQRLESIFDLLDQLCRRTCPDCVDVCCQRAWVWLDFRDLLFLHLAGLPLPGEQLLSRIEDHCRYASASGCRLERLRRPFVCTWYLCPVHTGLMLEKPVEYHWLQSRLQQIKEARRRMEDAFIQAAFSR